MILQLVNEKNTLIRVDITNCKTVEDIADSIVKSSLGFDLGKDSLVSTRESFRIISNGKVLDLNQKVSDLNIDSKSFFLLVPKRTFKGAPKRPQPKWNNSLIEEATESIFDKDMPTTQKEPNQTNRTVLIQVIASLAKIGQKIQELSGKTEVEKEAEEGEDPFLLDEDSIQNITSLGYSREVSIKSLLLNFKSPRLAREWLEKNEDSDTLSSPLTEEEISLIKKQSKSKFKPKQQNLENLIMMGFHYRDCVVALRMSDNDFDRALQWLLGEIELQMQETESVEHMSIEHPLLKKVLSNLKIQNGLNNPKIAAALLEIKNDPRQLFVLFEDHEVSSFLNLVSQIMTQ